MVKTIAIYRGIFCAAPGEKQLTCSRLQGLDGSAPSIVPMEKQSAHQGRKILIIQGTHAKDQGACYFYCHR